MDKETNLILIKIKNNLYNQNYNKKRTIKINFKFLLFTISILINIFFCLKFLFDHVFSLSEKINLNIATKKLILVNISNSSSSTNNYVNNHSYYHSDDILLAISKKLGKNINRVDILALSGKMNIGNQLIALNNAIYFCEILKCREILVDKSIKFIKKEFFYNKFNMTIKLNKKTKCKKPGVVCLKNLFFFYDLKNKMAQHRFSVFQEEFLSNVPKYESNENDLYIHIRSGDVFSRNPHYNYAQPPLCFYEYIINNFNFSKIFIVSKDRKNPVINALLNKYKTISFLHNDLSQDISYIINAYNLVISISSFSLNLARLSKKLKKLFVFDITPKEEKDFWLIDDNKYKENFTTIIMKVSDEYKSEMRPWKSNKYQKALMLNAICRVELNTFSRFS